MTLPSSQFFVSSEFFGESQPSSQPIRNLQIQKQWNYSQTHNNPATQFVKENELSACVNQCYVDYNFVESVLEQAEKEIAVSRQTNYDKPPTLERTDYYCIPSITELSGLPIESLKNIPQFEVGRPGYGRVKWTNVDVTNLDLDMVVIIERGSVEVYPDGVTKHQQGEKLNKEALITLENTHDTETEFESALDSFPLQLSGIDKFNRSITFAVPHFTMYGFLSENKQTKTPIENINVKLPEITITKVTKCPFEINVDWKEQTWA
ncbi:Peptidase S59 domain-containing protein [Entamoeba marina]